MRCSLLLFLTTFAGNLQVASAADHWVGTWAASPAGPPADVNASGLTVREIIHTSIAGNRVQIRFTNILGKEPLVIAAVHVGIRSSASGIVEGSDRALTFGGRADISIPPAAVAVCDPVQMTLPAQTDLAISVYVSGRFPSKTMHPSSNQTSYLAPGDLTAAATFPADAKTIPSWPFLSGVSVNATSKASAIVAFGDSITDGAHSTLDANARWPDVLARRLLAAKQDQAVLNAGIGGNRILHDGQGPGGPAFGPSGLSRFDRDVLANPGVRYVIVLEGINDLGHPGTSAPASETVSAEDIIAGLGQFIERAHAAGLRIFGGTLTPFEETTIVGYYSPDREVRRQAVNKWIRNGNAFDGVIDFEKAVRDPEHPTRMLAKYDSGDHLHPNDAGYKAMGEAVDLKLFTK